MAFEEKTANSTVWITATKNGSYALSVMALARALALGIGWYLVDCTLDSMVLRKNEEILRSDPLPLVRSFRQKGPS